MAKMFPEALSAAIIADPRKQGEVKVYNHLQRNLGNDWTVFHSVSWIGKVFVSGDKRDGETDFIIANPKYGIVIAEVKGGIKIEFDGNSSKWFSTSKAGFKNEIKDPFIQARDNKYSFITDVKTWRRWSKGIIDINVCHMVIFC